MLHWLGSADRYRVSPRVLAVVGLAVALGVGISPALAEVIFVSDVTDGIPAPPGSLREAIEKSETNPGPDEIVFLIDGGTIDLVAPLPVLTDGGLAIGENRTTGFPGGGSIFVSGALNGVGRALTIASGHNSVSQLHFVGFVGREAVLITGAESRGNVVSGAEFGDADPTLGNAGAGVRIGSAVDGSPGETTVRLSRFQNNDVGVEVEGPPSGLDQGWTLIVDNEFGTTAPGLAGPGNTAAIRVLDAGPVRIDDNLFSGPGAGILLSGGLAGGSQVVANQIGFRSSAGTCAGFTGPGVLVEGADGVVIRDNNVVCNAGGIRVAANAAGVEIRDNRISNNTGDGVALDAVADTLLRHNSIDRNGGFGVSDLSGIAVTPGTLLACNSLDLNGLGPLALSTPLLPPVLTTASPIAVGGDLPPPPATSVEVFGDDVDQARKFQGALALPDAAPLTFRHELPVLGVRLAKVGATVEIGFDREVPPVHTATTSANSSHETSELSVGLAAAPPEQVRFDLVRGDLANLGFDDIAGGITLGPVLCLATGLTTDPVVSPNPQDPDVPPPGEAFFYTLRRRHSLANQLGTYDPAICLTELARYGGPRHPRGGDCP